MEELTLETFNKKTPQEVSALSKSEILSIKADQIPNDARLTKDQVADLSKDEVIELNSILKYDFPKEKTYELVIGVLKEYISNTTFEDKTSQGICNSINSPIVDENGIVSAPIWYELVANIPGTENICTIELVEEALK